ncbi:sulfite oxidase [soil metagenome]
MTTTAAAPPEHTTTPSAKRVWSAAVAGLVATAVALGSAELLAGLVPPVPSLLLAIGDGVVDLGAGSRAKDIAIALFGTGEKTALLIGTVVLALLFGAGLGVVSRRRSLAWGAAGITAFGALGLLATTVSPLASTSWAVMAAAVAVGTGVWTLRSLLSLDLRIQTAAEAVAAGRGTAASAERVGRGRREFLRVAVGLTAVAGVAGYFGRTLLGRTETSAARAAVVLPPTVTSLGPTSGSPGGAAFASIDGLSPLFTPNDDFYRIDTALMPPVVDVAAWSMRVHGMVDQEVVLTYDDLLDLPQFEADVTIACVSNEVGGDLIGNARWQGVRLADVLEMAGVDPQATQIVGRSVDGWTAGFPTEIAFDGRDAMIAVAMNGEPLPIPHGFPARLIVPGLYGYVSATKWLSDLELTTWEAFDGYWIPRGWSKEGPIKTQSRIDVPRQNADVAAGEVAVAGVAWAQQRGLERVEVSIDEGAWQEAELAEELNPDTWRQWRLRWDAEPGEHQIRVRATDRDGFTQSEDRVPVAPNGAEGYHTRVVRVA